MIFGRFDLFEKVLLRIRNDEFVKERSLNER